MRSYGIYQDIRNTAWRCLIKNKISSLPVDILKVAHGEGNVRVIKNSAVDMLAPDEHARSYFGNEIWYIVYDDTRDITQVRYAIAHELGHYFLHHDSKYIKYSADQPIRNNSISENQADSFACRLLCPSCILFATDAMTPEEISKVCLVDIRIAKERAKRLKTLKERNCFFKSPLEKELYEAFLPYVEAHKKTK